MDAADLSKYLIFSGEHDLPPNLIGNVSENFRLYEVIRSQDACRLKIDNRLPVELFSSVEAVAHNILEPVRAHYEKPISPSSWYRSRGLNQKLRSSPKSQHCAGEAVDFEVMGVSNLELAGWCHKNLEYDQLILEYHDLAVPQSGWLHISYKLDGGNRKEDLRIYVDDSGVTRAERLKL